MPDGNREKEEKKEDAPARDHGGKDSTDWNIRGGT